MHDNPPPSLPSGAEPLVHRNAPLPSPRIVNLITRRKKNVKRCQARKYTRLATAYPQSAPWDSVQGTVCSFRSPGGRRSASIRGRHFPFPEKLQMLIFHRLTSDQAHRANRAAVKCDVAPLFARNSVNLRASRIALFTAYPQSDDGLIFPVRIANMTALLP